MIAAALLLDLSAARTLSGREIFRAATNHENHLRARASELSYNVVSFLESQSIPDRVLRDTVSKLRAAFREPRHYGENTPGLFFEDGTPTVEAARFDYFDFIGFALSGEGGFQEFTEIVHLDSAISYSVLMGLVSLLLIDAAIVSIDGGEYVLGGSDLVRSAEAHEEMLYQTHRGNWLAQSEPHIRKQLAQKAGKARHRTTNVYRVEIIEKWDLGQWPSQAAAARWATQTMRWPINGEVVKRWIRAHGRKRG